MFAKVATSRLFASRALRQFSVKAINDQKLIIALGGNALLQRGQPMTMENQQESIAEAAQNLRNILNRNTICFVHGNGPQVGLLALQDAAYHKENGNTTHLDILDAETEGMIGYLLEQELDNVVDKVTVTILSQIEVDPKDPAFHKPTKFIGPVYNEEEAKTLHLTKVESNGEYWVREGDEFFKRDGEKLRRVVASPLPLRLLELDAIQLLVDRDFIVICAGGGGIPVVRIPDESGRLITRGVEAVIDKDRAATMLGLGVDAHGLMILTDVPGVATNFGDKAKQKWIKSVSPEKLQSMMKDFPAGSMGPKVESAIEFVTKSGGWCTIGSLMDADLMMKREAGTLVTNEYGPDHIKYY